ncbi:MAG: CAP domain-containing protein [Candidatus Micrarchaeaceae archaeon]
MLSTKLINLNTSSISKTPINIKNVSVIFNNKTIILNTINLTQLDNYTLNLINNDREKFGLKPVVLSNLSSAQQHAESMLENNYFSHWDLYGMKPYMRYTLLGGKGSMKENIAVEKSELCSGKSCIGNINVTKAISQMEYSMMYNDSICCNNGHRDNILDPNHNEVSIGIAYNSSTVYFVEDFTNNYINWSENTPGYSNNGNVYLYGNLPDGLSIKTIYISYDKLFNYTDLTVPSGPYSFGTTVAGIVQQSNYYYTNLTTIVANYFNINNNSFQINFNIKNITKKYGSGVYTIITDLENNRNNSIFMGSDYSIFINSSDKFYIPKNV